MAFWASQSLNIQKLQFNWEAENSYTNFFSFISRNVIFILLKLEFNWLWRELLAIARCIYTRCNLLLAVDLRQAVWMSLAAPYGGNLIHPLRNKIAFLSIVCEEASNFNDFVCTSFDRFNVLNANCPRTRSTMMMMRRQRRRWSSISSRPTRQVCMRNVFLLPPTLHQTKSMRRSNKWDFILVECKAILLVINSIDKR